MLRIKAAQNKKEVILIKKLLMTASCIILLSGCGSHPKKEIKADVSNVKMEYTAHDLVRMSGYRKGAVKLPSHVDKPNYSTKPTALSIQLKAEHLLMNKGIDLKKRKMTDEDVRKAGYGSVAELKSKAEKILIKQNKELKPVITGSMVCAEAFSKAKITVISKDKKTYKKIADAKYEKDVEKMLFVAAVIAKEHVTLSKKELETSSSTYSSYTGIYKNPAARLAGEKALALYCKSIVK